jgi:hypothetical protein
MPEPRVISIGCHGVVQRRIRAGGDRQTGGPVRRLSGRALGETARPGRRGHHRNRSRWRSARADKAQKNERNLCRHRLRRLAARGLRGPGRADRRARRSTASAACAGAARTAGTRLSGVPAFPGTDRRRRARGVVSPIPRRGELAAPDAGARALGLRLGLQVVRRVLAEVERHALANDPLVPRR